MPPVSIISAADRVRAASSLPTTERGSILPPRIGGPLTPGWSVWETQARTIKVEALRWPKSRETYEDMTRDPQIQGLLMSVFLPIRHMDWYVDPRGTTGTVAEEIAEDFGLRMDGDGQHDEDGPGVDFDEHLRLALLALAYGHKPFEESGIIEGTGLAAKYRLRRLHERPLESIERIDVTGGGDLLSIRVPAADPVVDGPYVDIPDDHLLYYCWDRRGADWGGRPLTYGLYRSWLLKDEMVREDAVLIRRFSGIPVVETTDPNVGSEALEKAAEMATAIQAGDGAGVATPYGTRLRILGIEGTRPYALDSIKYHDGQMARAFMQMVMELGNTQHGSRALGATLMDHYALGVLAIAKWVRKTQMTLVRRIVERNYGPGTPLPHIRSRADEHEDIPLDTLGQLIDSGAITVDDDLEAQIRERGNLVPRNPAQTGRVTPAVVPAIPAASAPAAAARAHRYSPPMAAAATVPAVSADSPIAPAQVDFEALQTTHMTALAELNATWRGVQAALIADLHAQVAAATTVAEVATVTPTILGGAVLAAALVAVVAHGAQTARDEAAAQGVTLPEPDLTATQALITEAADATATLLCSALGQSASSAAVASWGPTTDAEFVADAVQAHLEGLAGATADYELSGLASQAQNAGRFHVLDNDEPGNVYSSELNDDPNICEPCREVNDIAYPSMTEARRDYPRAGYVACKGIQRCRGTLVKVYAEA